jgi:hypothetical protein
MRLLTFLLLAALSVFGACATSPATKSVSYTLPATPGGRMCANQCLEAQDYCRQSCDISLRQCVTDVQATAIGDYDKYTREQFSSHEAIELRPSDFERQAPCNNRRKDCAEDCDHHYQSCYADCGGQVNVTSSCQFFCF